MSESEAPKVKKKKAKKSRENKSSKRRTSRREVGYCDKTMSLSYLYIVRMHHVSFVVDQLAQNFKH